MKLFDIQGDQVIIHDDTLGLPCFRKLWESVDNKARATDYISYIVFKNKYNSPYVKAYPVEERGAVLRKRIFGSADFTIPQMVLDCETEYINLTETLFIGLVKNSRDKLESISKYYKESLNDVLDPDIIKVIIASMKELGNTAKSLELLEEQARKEESMLSTKIRGGADLNVFEVPNRR